MRDVIKVPGMISGISTLKDKTLKMTVYVTREIDSESKAKIFDQENNEGWFLFSPNDIQPNDVPQDNAKFDGRKSPSERLYAVQYVYWSQEWSGKYPNFNQWREAEMENLINDYKAKLN